MASDDPYPWRKDDPVSIETCPECGVEIAQWNISRNEFSTLYCTKCEVQLES